MAEKSIRADLVLLSEQDGENVYSSSVPCKVRLGSVEHKLDVFVCELNYTVEVSNRRRFGERLEGTREGIETHVFVATNTFYNLMRCEGACRQHGWVCEKT